ncbi:MAG TPA: AraC family transcriptional regulator [Aestuariivirga sp.]|jgi:AraC-like DNA-binding protein|nr:AraC family transcriptional regulator [Aestuariivirga sp.]
MTETPALPAETPFRAESAPDPAGLDVLSDVLRVFRTSGAALLRGEFAEPWTLDMPHGNDVAALLHSRRSRVVMFHIVAEGGCWVDVGSESRVWLEKGDMIGFPLGHQHFMGAGEGGRAVRLSSTLPPPPWTGMPIVRLGSGGPLTQMICVYLHCDKLLFNPILESLPPQIVVRPRKEAGHWIDATLRYIIVESLAGSQGSNGVIARLTELLFIEILRQHMTELRGDSGWLAALGDRHMAKALQALHGNPRHRWTVAELSFHVGMSRSALAARFHHFLSQAPMSYLAKWRFQLAAQALQSGDRGIAHVAAEIGYESEEAFSRAFRRHAGVTPTEWRRVTSSASSEG